MTTNMPAQKELFALQLDLLFAAVTESLAEAHHIALSE
jgi:hypothetical protein